MLNARHQSRTLTTVLFTVMVWLVAAAAAHAQAVATATPSQPGKGSRLHWDVDGTLPPITGQIPTSLTMSAPPGFVLNTAAVATRCKRLQAELDECPSKSRIGSALMIIHVEKPSGPRDLPIDIKLYLGTKNGLLAVAFLAGVRVVPGSIRGSNGIALTFNPLPVPPVIPNVSYQFRRVTVALGANRKITRKVKGHKQRKTVRIDLVRTPPNCASGAWGLAATLGLPNGTTALLGASVACSAAA
jgi:hypothetical protein